MDEFGLIDVKKQLNKSAISLESVTTSEPFVIDIDLLLLDLSAE